MVKSIVLNANKEFSSPYLFIEIIVIYAMNIVVITPVYPQKNAPKGTTPVVHFFTREWVKMGHRVKVFHINTRYPSIYYWISSRFESFLNSKLGFLVFTKPMADGEELNEGVEVKHFSLSKIVPHTRFKNNQIKKAASIIKDSVQSFNPSVIIGHWDIPTIDLLIELKKDINVPEALVLHSGNDRLKKNYGTKLLSYINKIDAIGFRSESAKKAFESAFGLVGNYFYAYSGVSSLFSDSLDKVKPFDKIESFTYAGSLIQRKHPVEIVYALSHSYQDKPFSLTYIGEGKEKESINEVYIRLGCKGKLIFTGRISRESIIDYLRETDVFIMISEREVFGLVYLEAMALGCITIASRGEGMDGIIKDGINGFLCTPGDANDLSAIIDRIKEMPKSEIIKISQNAINTARDYSDYNVANRYLGSVKKICRI